MLSHEQYEELKRALTEAMKAAEERRKNTEYVKVNGRWFSIDLNDLAGKPFNPEWDKAKAEDYSYTFKVNPEAWKKFQEYAQQDVNFSDEMYKTHAHVHFEEAGPVDPNILEQIRNKSDKKT